MHARLYLIALFSLGALCARGGEKPTLHLTGNPSVDFFSDPKRMLNSSWSVTDASNFDMADESENGGKSPLLAGVLSLAIPGAGEVYTNSYLKAGIFAAIEATSWIVAYSYNKKGDRQTDLFQNFANAHWSASKYVNWVLENLGTLDPTGQSATYWGNRIYPNGYDPAHPPSYRPPYNQMSWHGINAMEDEVRQTPDNGFSHLLPPWNDQQYYELIGKYDQFSRGWDDAQDDLLSSGDLPVKSNSKLFYQYAQMRAQANHYYDVAGTWVSVAIVNHIVSALDAFWSATRLNKNLHAEVRLRPQPTEFGLVPVTEAKIRFDF